MEWPPTANTYYRNVGGKTLLSAKGRAYKAMAQEAFYQMPYALTGPVGLYFHANPPDRRMRDLDNMLKPLLDVLESNGLFAVGDSQVDELRIVRFGQEKGGLINLWIAN